jgi:transcriptional regulator with XRE-family HTH domain
MEREEDPEVLRLAVLVLRISRGLTQKELATAAGMAPSSISGYESGRTKVTRKTADRIAVAAGVDLWIMEPLLLSLRPLCRNQKGRPAIGPPSMEAAIEDFSHKVGAIVREAVEMAMADWEWDSPLEERPGDDDLDLF